MKQFIWKLPWKHWFRDPKGNSAPKCFSNALATEHMVFSVFIINDNSNGKHNWWALTLRWTLEWRTLHIFYNSDDPPYTVGVNITLLMTEDKLRELMCPSWWTTYIAGKGTRLLSALACQISKTRPITMLCSASHSFIKDRVILSRKGNILKGIAWSDHH